MGRQNECKLKGKREMCELHAIRLLILMSTVENLIFISRFMKIYRAIECRLIYKYLFSLPVWLSTVISVQYVLVILVTKEKTFSEIHPFIRLKNCMYY